MDEIEPFVRALAAWRGDADTAWGLFQDGVPRLLEEEGHTFLPALVVESLSSYTITGTYHETPLGYGEGYSGCQRALRQLAIDRLEDLESKPFHLVLEAFKHRLNEHGLGCYGIGTDSEMLCVLIAKNPAEFEEIANELGIELDTSWPDLG